MTRGVDYSPKGLPSAMCGGDGLHSLPPGSNASPLAGGCKTLDCGGDLSGAKTAAGRGCKLGVGRFGSDNEEGLLCGAGCISCRQGACQQPGGGAAVL